MFFSRLTVLLSCIGITLVSVCPLLLSSSLFKEVSTNGNAFSSSLATVCRHSLLGSNRTTCPTAAKGVYSRRATTPPPLPPPPPMPAWQGTQCSSPFTPEVQRDLCGLKEPVLKPYHYYDTTTTESPRANNINNHSEAEKKHGNNKVHPICDNSPTCGEFSSGRWSSEITREMLQATVERLKAEKKKNQQLKREEEASSPSRKKRRRKCEMSDLMRSESLSESLSLFPTTTPQKRNNDTKRRDPPHLRFRGCDLPLGDTQKKKRSPRESSLLPDRMEVLSLLWHFSQRAAPPSSSSSTSTTADTTSIPIVDIGGFFPPSIFNTSVTRSAGGESRGGDAASTAAEQEEEDGSSSFVPLRRCPILPKDQGIVVISGDSIVRHFFFRLITLLRGQPRAVSKNSQADMLYVLGPYGDYLEVSWDVQTSFSEPRNPVDGWEPEERSWEEISTLVGSPRPFANKNDEKATRSRNALLVVRFVWDRFHRVDREEGGAGGVPRFREIISLDPALHFQSYMHWTTISTTTTMAKAVRLNQRSDSTYRKQQRLLESLLINASTGGRSADNDDDTNITTVDYDAEEREWLPVMTFADEWLRARRASFPDPPEEEEFQRNNGVAGRGGHPPYLNFFITSAFRHGPQDAVSTRARLAFAHRNMLTRRWILSPSSSPSHLQQRRGSVASPSTLQNSTPTARYFVDYEALTAPVVIRNDSPEGSSSNITTSNAFFPPMPFPAVADHFHFDCGYFCQCSDPKVGQYCPMSLLREQKKNKSKYAEDISPQPNLSFRAPALRGRGLFHFSAIPRLDGWGAPPPPHHRPPPLNSDQQCQGYANLAAWTLVVNQLFLLL